jgi:hypothetical protein
MPQAFYPSEKGPWYPFDMRLGEPHKSGHNGKEEKKKTLPPSGTEPYSLNIILTGPYQFII